MYTTEMRNKELNNGRMAMMSVLGIFAAEVMTGKDAMQQFGLSAINQRVASSSTASTFAGLSSTRSSAKVARHFFASPKIEEVAPPPPFDPAGQVGALAPLGYFDPMGYCKVGDEEGFRNFRAAELKHGRVAMMASVGAVAQHFVKFPIFEDVKGTFGAGFSPEGIMYSFPLLMLIGVIEFTWVEGPEKEPGNFGDPLSLDMYTTEMRNKELNNGRMAMMSVLGIFAAEVMTGKDAMQQFGLSAINQRVASSSTACTFAGLSRSRSSAKVARHFFASPKTEEVAPPPPPFDPAGQ